MEKMYKKLVGKKVLGVGHGIIYFEGDIAVSFHEYETYIENYNKEKIDKKNLLYFSPSFVSHSKESSTNSKR